MLFKGTILFLLLLLSNAGSGNEKICSSISMTMSAVIKAQTFADCTAVDGNVVLSMLDMNAEMSFANLREISGFLVLYRLRNLTSLERLFPQLTVIRGLNTHDSYALVLFDLPDLQDMALPNLRKIDRGGIRVESAPKLCYYRSVNFSAILNPQFKATFHNVPDKTLCRDVCPGKFRWHEGPDRSDKYVYNSLCPKPDNCWSQKICQQQCSPVCGAAGCLVGPEADKLSNPSGTCCPTACLGGCFNLTTRDCAACRGFRLNGACVDRCPKGYVSYRDWVCIRERDCVARLGLPGVKSASSNTLSVTERTRMKLYNGTCVQACPLGYAVKDGRNCVKCEDARNCARYCDAQLVHSIEDLEAVKGCTIMPQLIISLSDNIPNVEKRLMESFRDLTEIEQSLMVINSPSLTSLSFLSNLRVIRGERYSGNGMQSSSQKEQQASLTIEHTDFLQSLWNTTNGQRLRIAKGKVRFYMNRRLCNHRIQEFVKNTLNVTDPIDVAEDLSPRTNGDLASCINRTFNILVGLVTSRSVMLHWPMLQVKDKRALLGYSIYYRQVRPDETVQYADPSTCEIRQWQTMFTACTNLFVPDNTSPSHLVDTSGIPVNEDGSVEGDDTKLRVSCHLSNCSQCVGDCQKKLSAKQCQFMVPTLKPASRYAMFVMPQLVIEQQQAYGSKSRIIYVDTMPTQPSPPHDFKVEFQSASEMRLSWKPPLKPNGNVTHYLLRFKEMPSDQDNLIYVDDCSETGTRPSNLMPVQQQPQQQPTAPSDPGNEGPGNRLLNFTVDCQKHCSCGVQPDLRQREDVIYFEDTLFKILFTRRPPESRSIGDRLHEFKPRPPTGNASSSGSGGASKNRPKSSSSGSMPTPAGEEDQQEEERRGPSTSTTSLATSTARTTATTAGATTLEPTTPGPPPTVDQPGCDNEQCPRRIIKQLDSPSDNRRWIDGYVTVRGTGYTVTNLKHFTHYELSLIACQEEFRHPQYQTILHLCSNPTRIIQRTSGRLQADQIPGQLRFESPEIKEHPGDVRLLWRKPKNPNGVVRYYEVQYKGPSHRNWQYVCVSYREWLLSGQPDRQPLLRTSRSVPDDAAASLTDKAVANDSLSANNSDTAGTADKTDGRQDFGARPQPAPSPGDSNNPSFATSNIGGVLLRDLPKGTYQFQVRAVTSQGQGDWSPVASTDVPGRAATELATALGLTGAVAVLLFCALLGWLVCRQRGSRKTIVTENPDYWSYTYAPDEWEVPRDQVTYSEEDILGTGSFGRVYRGVVRSLSTPAAPYLPSREDVPVAVKNVNEKATMRERHEFLQEATHMKKFRQCAHVVRLIGVVSENVPILVLMELMENGDLKTCLRQMRPDSDDPISRPMYDRNQLVLWCAQIADGMFYLETKKYVHRDLAARNCMVTADYCVKIGDFGMTRDVYYSDYYKKEGQAPLPVRWMAPESLRDGVFTTATDVWSYGVVLWEIATLAHQPFNSRSNEEVVNMVKSGKTLQPPEDCPDFLSELMAHCWSQRPRSRSTFRDLLVMLDEMPELTEAFRQQSWFHNGSVYSQGDSAVSVTLPDRSSKRLSQQIQQQQQHPQQQQQQQQHEAALKPPEEIPMLGPQSVPNPYVPLRA